MRAVVRARVVVFVYLAALVPAVAMAMLQPVWSRVDEAQHADVLAQYSHGVVPVEGVTKLRPEIVAIDDATGVYRWYPPGVGPAPAESNPDAFVAPPASAGAVAQRVWMTRHLWGFSYEAMQPPLYYLLAEPDWILGARFGGTMGAIYAARLFSALIAACLAPLVYLLALVVRPGAERMALLAAGIAAILPGYVLNATQITNDGLAGILGAGLTLVVVLGARNGWTKWLSVTCGVLLGAAAMTKLTAVGLAPLAAAGFLWPGVQTLRTRVAFGMIAAAVAAAVIAPWLVFNLNAYGQPLPSHATRELLGAAFGAPPKTAGYLLASARNAFDEFVAGEPFAIVPLTRLLVWLAEAVLLLAAIGLWISRKRLRLEWLLLVGIGGDCLWVLGTPFLSGVGGLMPGRYLYPVAAAVLVVVAAGLVALPRMLARGVAAAGGAAALVALILLVSSQSGLQLHAHAAPQPETGTAVQAQARAAGLDVVADRVWITDGGQTVWIHVTLTDLGSQPVDLPALPLVSTAPGRSFFGDYPSSTVHLERLDPGESESGWMCFTRAERSPITTLRVIYYPISSDGYATIESLSLVVAP